MKILTECPRARPMAANAIPVLPLVASAIVSPECSCPLRYASLRICSAMRSLKLGRRAAGAGDPGEAKGDCATKRAEAGNHPPRRHTRPRRFSPAQTLRHPVARRYSAALELREGQEVLSDVQWCNTIFRSDFSLL